MAKSSGSGNGGARATFWSRGGGGEVTLTGKKLTGDTFRHRDWIKNKLGGKWDSSSKSWEISDAGVSLLKSRGSGSRFGPQ